MPPLGKGFCPPSFVSFAIYGPDIDRQDIDESKSEPVPVFLIGNKIDLTNKREVSTKKGQKVRNVRGVIRKLTKQIRVGVVKSIFVV